MLVEAQPIYQRPAWNLGRIIGPKPPLKPRSIWAIRTRLQHDRRVRDFAMFNLAIDSKLQGCDLVRLRVSDVVLGGAVRLRTSINPWETTRKTNSKWSSFKGSDHHVGAPATSPSERGAAGT